MNTIIIDGCRQDGERLAAECMQAQGIEVAGIFSDSSGALEYAETQRVDFALLEAELEPMDGFALARRLREINPQMILIFVSGQGEYALPALQVKADYFVIKPYKTEEIQDALVRAKLLSRRQQKRVFIRAFGRFDVFVDGHLVQFPNAKSKELFALCVDRVGGEVSMDAAIDRLWPDRDYDSRVKALYRKAVIGVHSVLEEQGVPEVFCNRRGVCFLNDENVECDYFDYLHKQGDGTGQYTGEYMFEYSWAEETNAWLQKKEKI